MNRRKFLKNGIRATTGIGLLAGVYTWQIEPFWLEFTNVIMPVKNLPDHLVGKTMMQISDIHVGNRFDYNYLIKSLERAKSFHPDIVVYTGDYVSYESEEQIPQLKTVLRSVVQGKLATIGILGNHDYGINWAQDEVAEKVVYQLERVGIQVLRNEQTSIGGLNVIGLDDYWGLNFEPTAVLSNVDPTGANLVLCHNPDVCDLNIWSGYEGRVLSGHTHGGQCKPPFLKPPLLPVKNDNYAAGYVDLEDGRHLYINRALGHLHQVRFNVRPEITIFHLEQA